MPTKKKKTGASLKKPFKVLSRKAMTGWLVAIFIACGWMFALGVLVGRDQAPIEFDVDALEKKITRLRQRESVNNNSGSSKNSGAPRDKKQLDFYEALPENREDTNLPRQLKPKKDTGEPKPSAMASKPLKEPASSGQLEKKSAPSEGKDAQPPPEITVADVKKGSYTIQAASVRNKPDADRMVSKLRKGGYPAYLLTSQIAGKGTWHRVRIGTYSSSDAAKPVLAKLRKSGMKPILVKTK